jgi:hypothetical protein
LQREANVHQDALTIVAPLKPERRGDVVRLLDEMKLDPSRNGVLPFGALRGCHFGRVVLIPSGRGTNGHVGPDALLLASDCDGSADDHLTDLVDTVKGGLDRLFGACEGYPTGAIGRNERLAYLSQKRLRPSAYYVHQQGRTVEQIAREERLRKQIQSFVGSHRLATDSALRAREQIRTFVQQESALAWALEPAPQPGLGFKLREALHHASLPLGFAALSPVAVPAIALLLLAIRLMEAHDQADDIRPSAEKTRVLTELENLAACSGYTATALVKPGVVRQLTVHGLLEFIGWGARHVFTRSSLAGVKTIHFARWIPIGNGRVVFVSNFDGSVESYNNDFIDLVGAGLNLIFSNAQGYPRTTWLIRGGAFHEQKFKDYLRRVQVPTPVWHSAYRHLTVANINRNAKLRAGLSTTMNEEEARQWLRLI